LGKLPSGAVVIRDSSASRNTDYSLGDSSRITSKNMTSTFMSSVIGSNSNAVNRIFITYPLQGWVSLSMTTSSGNQLGKLNLLQPLQFKTDLRCSPRFFLDYTDLIGGNIGNVEQPLSVASATACCNACSSSLSCFSWTFTPENSCWLKDQRAKKVSSEIKLVSGIFSSGTNGKIKANYLGLAGETAISNTVCVLCCTDEEVEKQNMENTSPEILRIKRTTTDWSHQWPIGTGKFGALVGGTLEREVIPLSIAGLFVIKTEEDIQKKNQEKNIRNKDKSEGGKERKNNANNIFRSKMGSDKEEGYHGINFQNGQNYDGDPHEGKSEAWKAFNRSR
jgi:hypothetical protein